MPRSFLVKKTKGVDNKPVYDGYTFDLISESLRAVTPYTPNYYHQPLTVTINNGYIHDTVEEASLTPVDDDTKENENAINLVVPQMCGAPQLHTPMESPPPSDEEQLSDDVSECKSTYNALLIGDGRSRRRNPNREGALSEKENRQRYTCNECGKHYATSSNLSRHKQTHRNLDGGSAKCPHCGKTYASTPALSMHILTHDLKHSCDICQKSFSRPWLLQGHLRSHTGEKPFGCAHCGKAFADRSNLRAHMQTHSSNKSFQCKRCKKSFALKSYLNKHYESACVKDDFQES